MKYEIIFDYYDDVFSSTLKETADTYEEAVRIKDNLKENPEYGNIQIVEVYEGEYE